MVKYHIVFDTQNSRKKNMKRQSEKHLFCFCGSANDNFFANESQHAYHLQTTTDYAIYSHTARPVPLAAANRYVLPFVNRQSDQFHNQNADTRKRAWSSLTWWCIARNAPRTETNSNLVIFGGTDKRINRQLAVVRTGNVVNIQKRWMTWILLWNWSDVRNPLNSFSELAMRHQTHLKVFQIVVECNHMDICFERYYSLLCLCLSSFCVELRDVFRMNECWRFDCISPNNIFAETPANRLRLISSEIESEKAFIVCSFTL